MNTSRVAPDVAAGGTPRPAKRRTELWAAAAGVAAVGAGVVVGELAAGLLSPSVSPVTAVGGAVIDAVPPGVKDGVIALFGTADKLALLSGMGLVIAALAALAGVLEWRRRFAGLAVIAVFGLVGLAAVLTRAEATANAVPVPLLGAALGMALLRWLIRRLGEWREAAGLQVAGPPAGPQPAGPDDARPQAIWRAAPGPETGGPQPAGQKPAGPHAAGPEDGSPARPARRRFLQSLTVTTAIAAVGGALASTLRGAADAVAGLRSKLLLPGPASPAPAVPAGAELGLAGLSPLVTPNRDFYRIDTALRVPIVDPRDWKLKVTGLVDREIELDFDTLLAKPLTERHITIACVSNEVGGDLIGNARWLGWPVRELLAQAGPKPGADMVLSRSADGWTAGSPLEALTDTRDALLVVGMNGEPLPLEHGFPVRLIVPGLYGYVSATKWVTELKVTRFADDVAYWTPRGWSERGPIKTSSRIDVPRGGRSVSAGTVAVGGVAWAQHRGIGKVEVRVNRGDWKQAELAPAISTDTWCQWKIGLPLGPGQYEVQVRATDLDGDPQVEDSAPPAPNGATGYHTVTVDVKS
ncbi:MAG: molybdopterin-dependent oxidoreductase [Arthrobacter sp.]|nr:molybdopterin-dependent oxidoreductase [Arthrobacter sp.]